MDKNNDRLLMSISGLPAFLRDDYLKGFRLIFHPFLETSTIQPSNSKISNVKCPNSPICAERIRLFQERKQIIINDVVTGKVKVSRNL